MIINNYFYNYNMDLFYIDIISLLFLISGIIWIYNNNENLKKYTYALLILIIIDLRVYLRSL